MKSRVIVAAVIEKEDKVLLGKRTENVGPYPNTWHLPGGGVKLGEESLKEALAREIKEEVGIEVNEIQEISFDEDYEPDKNGEMTHYTFLIYKVKYAKGTEKAGDDLRELKWFTKKDLQAISLARPSIKLFKKLGWI